MRNRRPLKVWDVVKIKRGRSIRTRPTAEYVGQMEATTRESAIAWSKRIYGKGEYLVCVAP